MVYKAITINFLPKCNLFEVIQVILKLVILALACALSLGCVRPFPDTVSLLIPFHPHNHGNLQVMFLRMKTVLDQLY